MVVTPAKVRNGSKEAINDFLRGINTLTLHQLIQFIETKYNQVDEMLKHFTSITSCKKNLGYPPFFKCIKKIKTKPKIKNFEKNFKCVFFKDKTCFKFFF